MTAPLVFLPGWCVGRGPELAAVDALKGTILDLPGYRDAPLVADFYAAADEIAARLQPRTHLCGWSLGAQMALAIAARAPEKVGKLVLIAGTGSFVQRAGWPHAMPPEMLAEFAANVATDIEGHPAALRRRFQPRRRARQGGHTHPARPRRPAAARRHAGDRPGMVARGGSAPARAAGHGSDPAGPRRERSADALARRRGAGGADPRIAPRNLRRLRPRPVHFQT
ncbi:MAG: alpha/beta fold hydrolase [Dechloromonas sp.]|uniref:Alpha/beta fold hydrolase n=1 Tax=Candidatus Dechloromonas phosphorivorans TaxID=2899244 RepID=A0A9D7LVX3_9RHOO|nr:alpha/beta fold hydrolase [Candidatus Dechloromonas phosphorivorans]